MYYYLLGAIVVGLLLWTLGSYAVIWSIEEPPYTVLEKKDGYEIREYQPYILAETTVTGDYNDATNQGFRIIADYIFGNNTAKQNIAMTVPVIESPSVKKSEKIAMTTPVLESNAGGNQRKIAFVLPSKYTLNTLPLPNNEAVVLTEMPARKVAALRFSWYPTVARLEQKKKQMLEYLMRDEQEIIGEVETARYNPPLSMPLMLRNEILVTIK